jgi:hypothetical protein
MSCSGCRWLVSRSVSVTSRSILADVTRYFSRCHPNAPFLYVDYDSDLDRVRSSSKLLLLAILCVGARFWSYSSRSVYPLHCLSPLLKPQELLLASPQIPRAGPPSGYGGHADHTPTQPRRPQARDRPGTFAVRALDAPRRVDRQEAVPLQVLGRRGMAVSRSGYPMGHVPRAGTELSPELPPARERHKG